MISLIGRPIIESLSPFTYSNNSKPSASMGHKSAGAVNQRPFRCILENKTPSAKLQCGQYRKILPLLHPSSPVNDHPTDQ